MSSLPRNALRYDDVSAVLATGETSAGPSNDERRSRVLARKMESASGAETLCAYHFKVRNGRRENGYPIGRYLCMACGEPV
jgi:hypothetical protein